MQNISPYRSYRVICCMDELPIPCQQDGRAVWVTGTTWLGGEHWRQEGKVRGHPAISGCVLRGGEKETRAVGGLAIDATVCYYLTQQPHEVSVTTYFLFNSPIPDKKSDLEKVSHFPKLLKFQSLASPQCDPRSVCSVSRLSDCRP